MHEDVHCPWCGSLMEPKGAEFESAQKCYIGQMLCPACGATGPVVKADSPWEATEGSVTAALEAMMFDPIDVDDLKDCDMVYFEASGVDQIVPVLISDEWKQSSRARCPLIMRGGLSFAPKISAYGKDWRAWKIMPSDAERKAAEWEE